MSLVWTYISIHVLFYGGLFSFALVGLYKRVKTGGKTIDLRDVTLVVPFRNEQDNISNLLSNIRTQEKIPNKIIFIDDHSEDEVRAHIKNKLNEFNLEVIGLPEEKYGKKEAIRLGIENSNTKYVVTLDADVSLSNDYFQNIELLNEADMWILPVHMNGNTWFQQIASIDFTLSNILNRFFALFKRPVLASGANLIFNAEQYRKFSKDDHYDILSGDDMFLLRDFRNNNLDIRVTSDLRFKVVTTAPGTVSDYLDQRIRWIGKTQRLGDLTPLVFAITNMTIGIFFYAALMMLFWREPWSAVHLLIFKLSYDLMLMAPHFIYENNGRAMLFLPLYDLILPIYSIAMALISAFYDPSWKGRPTKNKKGLN